MLDRTELVQEVHGWCPECGRFLRQWRGHFLCGTCWIMFEGHEVVRRESLEGLCVFSIIKDSEVQRWRVCGKCGKTWVKSWEEEYLFQVFNEEMFSREYVAQQRHELEESQGRNRLFCEEAQKHKDLVKTFIEYESSLGGLAPTD